MQKNNKILLSHNLKSLRKIKELTLAQFSNDLKLNIETVKNYDSDSSVPPLKILIKICVYFGISLDFLLLWDKTKYPKNICFLELAEIIDKIDQNKRYQMETTANSLLGSKILNPIIKLDDISLELTTDFHQNFKIIREKKGLSQQNIADQLNVTRGQVSFYENKAIPKIDKLIKLSDIFSISLQALSTGRLLNFKFKDQHLKETLLKADKFLSLEEIKFLTHLMQRIIEDSD